MKNSGSFRAIGAFTAMVAATQLLAAAAGQESQSGNAAAVVARFLDRATGPVPYSAWRRLEASCGKSSGWLEARTELTAAGVFRYQIVAEGGAGSIRNRVLRKVLQGEQESFHRGTVRRSSLTPENYGIRPEGHAPGGLFKLALQPLRKDASLIDGSAYVDFGNAGLVRVQGRLAKSPSFWARNVYIVRHYGSVAGTRMPVETSSTADIRLFGRSSFVMRYSYENVNGKHVRSAADARRALTDGTAVASLGN